MSFFKKLHSVVDPIGSLARHYGGKRSSSVRNFYSGLNDTLHFWDPNRVKRGVQKQWSGKYDPLGNQLNKMFFPEANSAQSFYRQNEFGIYGPTGSIVGKY